MGSHDSRGSLERERHELGALPPPAALPSTNEPVPASSEKAPDHFSPTQSTHHRRSNPSLALQPKLSQTSFTSSPPHTGITQGSDWPDHNHPDDTTEPKEPAWPVHHLDGSARRLTLVDEQDPTTMAADDAIIYPSGLPLFLLMLGISFSAFVVALDRTIVATAIPQITDDFHAPGDVGWYGSAYLLTSCAFQPTYGRVFAHFDVRGSFLVALGLFEVGSLICGVAQSSVMLIVGRSIAGLGCAGVFAGAMVIITVSVPLAKRPIFMGAVGSIFGIGAVCGPIIGGALTSSTTWRWCFYINLPAGLVTFVTLIFFFRPPKRATEKEVLRERLLHLDPVGNFLLITAVIMLLLALQWGGIDYAWSNSKIIGLLVGFGLMSIVFIGWQLYRGNEALIPPKVVSQRTVTASFLQSFFLSGALLVQTYYIPYWFQAIKDETAITSGVDTIPFLATQFVCSMAAGVFVTKTGYFNPPAILGGALATVGCGLITLLDENTSTGRWIGYLIVAGAGVGLAVQQGIVAVQAVLSQDVVPIATALVLFAQSLSGAIFVSVANSVLRNKLESGLEAARLPGVDVGRILAAGATEVRDLIPKEALTQVYHIYNDALDKVFIVAVPLAGLGMISALGMEWKSLKAKKLT